ncbi:MAG: hypothetical protein HKP30_14175 [Myxococcales bacterium]|nr:hypothetical protein [Myxococcales bacterium]
MPDDIVRRTLAARLTAALRLDRRVFLEVSRDPEAFPQAVGMVTLAGFARGIGALPYEGFYGLIGGVLAGYVLWVVCSTVVYMVGVVTFGGRADFPELLRTLGFASAPLFGLVFCAFPIGAGVPVIWWAAHLLALVAFTIAVRESLELPPQRAFLVCVIALALGLVTLLALGILFVGSTAAG